LALYDFRLRDLVLFQGESLGKIDRHRQPDGSHCSLSLSRTHEMTTVYHHPDFAAPIGDHIMPMRKFQLVADALHESSQFRIEPPQPASRAQLERVHTTQYIDAIETGEPRDLAQSQKFPWSPALYPSVTLTNGGLIAAAHSALQTGVSAAIASGFHHAHEDHGEGFCTFNGLILAAEDLRESNPDIRVAILDLDLHYGNGTASLAASRPWILALSIYGNDYVANTPHRDVEIVRHVDGTNHLSRALPNGSGLGELTTAMDWAFAALDNFQPDILLYQAGADPFKGDPYSPLDLDIDDLFVRDQRVFEFCKSRRVPVAWVLAGGYTPDISKVVEIHRNTFRACQDVY
jgi:acetoin utilization deacetylase AcuC-like enzyme